MEITLQDMKFKVTAKFIEHVYGFPFDKEDRKDWHNKFLISVTRFLDEGKVTRRFCFYGSTHNWQQGIKTLSDNYLEDTLRCFFDDALYGTEDFDDFCANLGYDTDSRTAERTYKACRRTLDKVQDMGIFESVLPDLINELSDREDNR